MAPDNLAAQQEIIKLEIHLGKLDAARERTEELLLTMPGSGVGEWLRGDVMMARKNYPAAVADYQTSIDLAGGSSVLAIRIYKARFSAGQRDEAIELLETWVGAHKDDYEAARTLAGAYISVRRLSKAIEVHEKMIADRPNDPKLLNNLAWLYQRTGDKRALTFAMRAYQNAPKDPSATDTLGWILVQSGQAARGLKLLRQANARAARQPRIRFHMAVALKQLNRLDEAREELKAVLQAAKKSDPELVREVQEQLDSLGK